MKKYCPECGSITKSKCELTVSKEDGVRRKNRCTACSALYYTIETETSKSDYDLARRTNV